MPTASSYGDDEMSLPLDEKFDSQMDREESVNADQGLLTTQINL